MRGQKPGYEATLLVKLGGLDVHIAVEVASPAYLISLLHATSTLVEATLPGNMPTFAG